MASGFSPYIFWTTSFISMLCSTPRIAELFCLHVSRQFSKHLVLILEHKPYPYPAGQPLNTGKKEGFFS